MELHKYKVYSLDDYLCFYVRTQKHRVSYHLVVMYTNPALGCKDNCWNTNLKRKRHIYHDLLVYDKSLQHQRRQTSRIKLQTLPPRPQFQC